MDLHLKGKRAIVLGGTRGIGRAIAETLAAEGANVAICARNHEQVEETVA
ncbi:MAG: SDR family NAD(P)-dependent oxidoreductase, partial [Alphaproteobacteria bacterium]|nr:SDR family NAD(P)-dependent oxidoreductase [Alphaproteobacteria bacterium]